MYILKTEHSFDSAHFLAGYEGKCANIHGHRWRVEIEVQAEELAIRTTGRNGSGFRGFEKGSEGRRGSLRLRC